MAGRQGEMRGNQRGGTQIAAGGFYLTDGLPRPAGGIGYRLTLIVTKEQHALLVA